MLNTDEEIENFRKHLIDSGFCNEKLTKDEAFEYMVSYAYYWFNKVFKKKEEE